MSQNFTFVSRSELVVLPERTLTFRTDIDHVLNAHSALCFLFEQQGLSCRRATNEASLEPSVFRLVTLPIQIDPLGPHLILNILEY